MTKKIKAHIAQHILNIQSAYDYLLDLILLYVKHYKRQLK